MISRFATAALLMGLASTQAAGQHHLMPNCPFTVDASWRDYFNNRDFVANAFIYFDDVQAEGEPWSGACVRYSVYAANQFPGDDVEIGWTGYLNDWTWEYIGYWPPAPHGEKIIRWNGNNWMPVDGVDQKTPNLEKFQVSVWDEIFTYNEAGELYHPLYGKVGQLKCVVPPPDASCMRGKAPIGQWFWSGGPY